MDRRISAYGLGGRELSKHFHSDCSQSHWRRFLGRHQPFDEQPAAQNFSAAKQAILSLGVQHPGWAWCGQRPYRVGADSEVNR